MNTARAKTIAWSSAALVGAGLALYMAYFAKSQSRVQPQVSEEEMRRVLEGAREVSDDDDQVALDFAPVKKSWIELNWTGKVKEVAEVTEVVKPVETAPVDVAIATVVKVQGIQWDPANDGESRAVLKYTPESRVDAAKTANGAGVVVKRVNDRLEPPHAYARVVAIDERGVEFAFDDAEREHEVVKPKELDLDDRFQVVGPDGKPATIAKPTLPRGAHFGQSPKNTQRLGPNEFRVGLEDAQYINQNYDRILAEEVRLDTHFDRRTRQRDGIEIKDIKPGSTLEKHGAQQGDVIKSINGHAVKSVQEAIQFVKHNADVYDKWDVEVENRGSTRIVTIYPPKEYQ